MTDHPLSRITDNYGNVRYFRPDAVTSAQLNHYMERTHGGRTYPESWSVWLRLLGEEVVYGPTFDNEAEAVEWMRAALYGLTFRPLPTAKPSRVSAGPSAVGVVVDEETQP
jgi:hypothetical protein